MKSYRKCWRNLLRRLKFLLTKEDPRCPAAFIGASGTPEDGLVIILQDRLIRLKTMTDIIGHNGTAGTAGCVRGSQRIGPAQWISVLTRSQTQTRRGHLHSRAHRIVVGV